jgi:hypothetical protein
MKGGSKNEKGGVWSAQACEARCKLMSTDLVAVCFNFEQRVHLSQNLGRSSAFWLFNVVGPGQEAM